MGKTAIFGGTFDPPHLGHRAMLRWIVKTGDFDNVLVMPANIPPHKSRRVTSAEDRLKMCRLAFGDIEKTSLCEEELRTEGKSYTVNTLESLKEKGVIRPTLLIGADSLVTFDKWRRYEDILKLADITVYLRGGIDIAAVNEAEKRFTALGGNITVTDYTPPVISSTEVRELIKSGGAADELLPPAVYKYIKQNKLYLRD